MNTNQKIISVIGLGYIGLPTAAVFASNNVKVIGVDVNANAVNLIKQGKIHIEEPELDVIVHESVYSGYLTATTTPETADVFIIAVPTPFKNNNIGLYEPDLKYVKAASKSISKVLKSGDLIILESTSPVGTTEEMAEWLAKERPDLTFPKTHGEASDIRIAYCPERVLPGNILNELIRNDRVIGGLTSKCSELASEIYKIFLKGNCFITTARTAEMCKLTENTFRDVNIAFANELSIICDKMGINTWELIRLANYHPRVNILKPGPGVGGHCIAVDPWFIVHAAPKQTKLIRAARDVNNSKPSWILEKIKLSIDKCNLKGNSLEDKKKEISVACFGLSFKPDIDDLRESPALEIVAELSKFHSGKIYVVEPYIKHLPGELQSSSILCSANDALENADIIVFLVAHKLFKKINKLDMIDKIIIDSCGLMEI